MMTSFDLELRKTGRSVLAETVHNPFPVFHGNIEGKLEEDDDGDDYEDDDGYEGEDG